MRPKSLILLSLALGCGLVAALGINQMMAKQKPGGQSGTETVDIFVALKEVNINDPLQAAALKLEAWPKDKVPPGALSKLDEVEGRRAKTKLYEGEPILDAKLLPKGEGGASPTDHIPTGFRVVSVRVDAVAATGNLIKPGDRVDMLVHLNQNLGRGLAEPTTKTFLQDVRVFAVNDIIDRDPANGNTKITAQTISLLVKPGDVELVMLAGNMGKIQLAMRGPADEEKSHTDGAVIAQLMGSSGGNTRRAEETRSADQEATPPSNPLTDLLNRLKGNSTPAATTAAPIEQFAFKMTLLNGPDIQEFEIDANSKVARLMSKPVDAGSAALSAASAEETSEEPEQSAEDKE
jgi:pilus assembly protein CpaB